MAVLAGTFQRFPLGAWAIGGQWGDVLEDDSIKALHRAIDRGVNFIDTADVYGDGRSERLVAASGLNDRETIYVATKAGRRLSPHVQRGTTARTSRRLSSAA